MYSLNEEQNHAQFMATQAKLASIGYNSTLPKRA